MKFIALLNQEIPLPKLMNALGHMAFGMGHRIEGEPSVDIFLGNTTQVRQFKTIAKKYSQQNEKDTVVSDFPHTMVGMSTDDLLKNVASTPEAEVTYFGACLLAETIPTELLALTRDASQLKGYEPHLAQAKASLLPEQTALSDNNNDLNDMKISVLASSKATLLDTVNSITLACLAVGGSVPYSQQRLLNLKGEGNDPYQLNNISFHSLVVVTTGKPYEQMAKAALANKTNKQNKNITVVFGKKATVESIIIPKSTRLFADKIENYTLVKATAENVTRPFFASSTTPTLPIETNSDISSPNPKGP